MSFPPSVGRYRIDRVLGSGAFASVWLGHDDALDSQVAIKVLSDSLIDDLDVRNRFLEEARILRRADSARLVRVHDIGELPDQRPYFVMSYADRGTLADRMRERPLPVAEAIALAAEIAYGVEVINALGVIHRDLKPSNVLFQSAPDGGERLLIADLGLAKALAHASGAFTLPVGTPGYMSPEQARFGGGLDVRADVYGLGALTYHMLTGRAPGPPPVKGPPSALREGVSPAVDAVVLRAMAAERETRWPTAEAYAEALATLRPTGTPDTAPPPSPQQAPPQAPSQAPPVASGPVPPAGEADATVQDRFHPADSAYSYAQGPGPDDAVHSQAGPPPPPPPPLVGHGQPGPPPPPAVEPEPRAAQEPPQPPVPPGQGQDPQQPPGGEQTIVDPPGAGYPAYQGAAPGPPVPPGQPEPAADAGRTSAYPVQGQGQGPPPTGFQSPPTDGGGGGGGKNRNIKPLIIGAAVLAVALVGGLLIGTMFTGDDGKEQAKEPAVPKDFVRMSDPTGKIRAAVPKVWPKGQEATWTPSSVGLADSQPRPVLRATPSVDDFLGNGRTPGVFIGLTTDVADGKLPPPRFAHHPQCTSAGPERYTTPDGNLSGTVTRFTDCRVGTPTVVEAGLWDKSGGFGVWIRVKENNSRDAATDILEHLSLTAP